MFGYGGIVLRAVIGPAGGHGADDAARQFVYADGVIVHADQIAVHIPLVQRGQFCGCADNPLSGKILDQIGLMDAQACFSKSETEDYSKAEGEYLEDKMAYVLKKGGYIAILDSTSDTIIKINYKNILNGFDLAKKNKYSIDIETMDMLDADIILQYACFGEVIYG